MTPPETERFTVDGMAVTVVESPGELRYAFAIPDGQSAGHGFEARFGWFNLVLVGVGAWLASALLAGGAGRPDWAVALAWLFVAQTIGMAALGMLVLTRRTLRRARAGGKPMELVFTRDGFEHRVSGESDGPVCRLAEVRGFRVFLFGGEQRQGNLSVVVGDAGLTHGIFGASAGEEMVRLARHLHDRLTAFRDRCGLARSLDPVEVIETGEEDAAERSHTLRTRRTRSLLAGLVRRGWWALLEHPAACAVWCVGIFAGAVGSARILAGAGMPMVLAGAAFVVVVHGFLLLAAWNLRHEETG